jgi:hypothetical protein
VPFVFSIVVVDNVFDPIFRFRVLMRVLMDRSSVAFSDSDLAAQRRRGARARPCRTRRIARPS